MKVNIKTLFMGILAVSLFSACEEDDATTTAPATTNNNGGNTTGASTLTFDGKNYDMTAGLVSDYGPAGENNSNTHYNIDFSVTDDAYVMYTETGSTETYYGPGNAATISVYIELFSPDTLGFKTGTFNYIKSDSTIEAKAAGKYYFSYGEVEFDNDGVVVRGDLDGPEYEVTGGSVTVTGSGPTSYTIAYNLSTSGGKTLTGTYASSFIYEDER